MLYFIGFETINFYTFFIKISYFESSYSFKNKELLKMTNYYKKREHALVQQCLFKLCTKFQGIQTSRSGTGAQGIC